MVTLEKGAIFGLRVVRDSTGDGSSSAAGHLGEGRGGKGRGGGAFGDAGSKGNCTFRLLLMYNHCHASFSGRLRCR